MDSYIDKFVHLSKMYAESIVLIDANDKNVPESVTAFEKYYETFQKDSNEQKWFIGSSLRRPVETMYDHLFQKLQIYHLKQIHGAPNM